MKEGYSFIFIIFARYNNKNYNHHEHSRIMDRKTNIMD